jgi:hypothetical protein
MRRTYEYLNDSYYQTENESIAKRNFLNKITAYVNQKQYVRITLLTWNEEPLKEIQGELTSGTLTKDGSSSVRRTCTFTASFSHGEYDIDNADYDFTLNKKIYIEIGVKNYTGEYEQYPILWFPQGVFFIGGSSVSSSSNGAVQIQLTLKDKMCGLNGTVGGTFPATTILDEVDTQDASGAYITEKVLISEIIREMVVHYGGEDINNIVIEDVPQRIKRTMRWMGDKTLYLIPQNGESAGTIWYEATLDEPTSGDYYAYTTGDDVGYVYNDFVYDDELTANLGETVTSVLDKIKSYLGNFEYFYDEFGVFHFREIKNYLNTTQATTLLTDMSANDYLVETTASKSVYTFEDKKNITSISVNPNYDNIKNDFVIQGQQSSSSSSSASYVRYHLVIDKKPTPVGEDSIGKYYNTYKKVLFYKEESTGLTKPCFVDNSVVVEVDAAALKDTAKETLTKTITDAVTTLNNIWSSDYSLEEKESSTQAVIDSLQNLIDNQKTYGISNEVSSKISQFIAQYNASIKNFASNSEEYTVTSAAAAGMKRFFGIWNDLSNRNKAKTAIESNGTDKWYDYMSAIFGSPSETTLKANIKGATVLGKKVINNIMKDFSNICAQYTVFENLYKKYFHDSYDGMITSNFPTFYSVGSITISEVLKKNYKQYEDLYDNLKDMGFGNTIGFNVDLLAVLDPWFYYDETEYGEFNHNMPWIENPGLTLEQKIYNSLMAKIRLSLLKATSAADWENCIGTSGNVYEGRRLETEALTKLITLFDSLIKHLEECYNLLSNDEEQEELNSQSNAKYQNALAEYISELSELTGIEDSISNLDMSSIYTTALEKQYNPGEFNTMYLGFDSTANDRDTREPVFCKYWDASANAYKDVTMVSYFSAYQVRDWRTELYFEGLMAKKFGLDGGNYYTKIDEIYNNGKQWQGNILKYAHSARIDTDYYYEELESFWPQVYDMVNQKFIYEGTDSHAQAKALTQGTYYLDFIDSSTSGLGQFSVSNIGRRTDAVTSEDVNCLFQPEIQNIVFICADNIENLDDEEFATQLESFRDECDTNGIPYTQVTSDIYNALSTGGLKNGAFDQVKYELYLHTTYQKSISLTALPIYYLEPNTRVQINDNTTNTYGDFNINSLSIPLGASGNTMTLSLSQASERF